MNTFASNKKSSKRTVSMKNTMFNQPFALGALLAVLLTQISAFHAPLVTRTMTRLGYSPEGTATGMAMESNDKQAVVDDYLEFLERRYNRMNENEGEQRNEAKFSAWKWLTQGSSSDDDIEAHSGDADSALHILGLADLASQRLLQKHSNSIKQPTTITEVIETTAVPVSRVSAVMQAIANQRKRLLSFQAAQVRALASAMWKAVKISPAKAAKTVINLGGGRKTIGVTVAVMFLLVRPLAQTIVSEGAQHV